MTGHESRFNSADFHTLEQLFGEMQTGCRSCHRTYLVGKDCLIAFIIHLAYRLVMECFLVLFKHLRTHRTLDVFGQRSMPQSI